MKKILLLVMGVVSFAFIATAQPSQDLVNRMMPKPVPVSPNVGSLGKFGDFQVSHFTGIPDISIPIYEVQSGSLKVPVTLSYHAAGIKPTDVASWVGLGWSLSAGGQISRSVHGKADEEYYSSNPLTSNLNNCGAPGTGTFYYMKDASTGVTDTEADVFSYSFDGRRGKFMLPYNSAPFMIPYAAFDVDISPGLQKFEFRNETGTLYRFGQNAQGISCQEATTATNGGNPTFSATTAWHIADIVSPNSNDEINFQYQNIGIYLHQDISYSYVIIDECYAADGGTCPNNSFSPQVHNNDSWGTQLGQSVITFKTGKVKFILCDGFRNDATGLKSLDRIEITDVHDKLYKTIKFNYSYFTDANGTDVALKLNSIEFKDKVGVVIQRFQFEYFTNSFSWNRGLSNFRNARDLWGYYNGALTNTDLVLTQTIPYQATSSSPVTSVTIGGASNRAVNTQYVKEGVLKKIIYPTGGYSEFDYESNQYLDNGVPALAGGLRIRQIKSSDGSTSSPVIKTYLYGVDGSGIGKPNFTPYQFNYHNTQLYYSDCVIQGPPIVNYQIRTFHSSTAFNQDPFDASPVRYTFVTEYFGDPAAATIGKITYEFDNGLSAGDVDHLVASSGKFYRNSLFWKRGKLTSKIVYDNANNPLSETNILYGEFKPENRLIGMGIYTFIAGNGACAGGNACLNEVNEEVHAQTHMSASYYQHTGVLLETQVQEKAYENGNINKFVSTQKTNSFEPSYLLGSEVSVTSNAGTYKTINRYPFQLSASSSSTGNAKGIYMLNEKHILSTPVETYTYVVKGSTENMVSAQVSTYRQNPANPAYVVPDEVYLWEPSLHTVAKSAYVESAINGSNDGITMEEDLKARVKMIAFSAEGDVLSASKINDFPVGYQYGYNKALPIAEVKNAQFTEFVYESFEEGTVTTSPLKAHTGKGYLNGDYSPTFVIPNGRSYIIEYWYWNGSAWIYNTKPYTGTSTLVNEGTAIDNVRIYPTDAFMTSYTHEPLSGITSIIGENGLVTYYDYDDFGRLWQVRNDKGNIEKKYTYHYKGN